MPLRRHLLSSACVLSFFLCLVAGAPRWSDWDAIIDSSEDMRDMDEAEIEAYRHYMDRAVMGQKMMRREREEEEGQMSCNAIAGSDKCDDH